MYIVRNSEGATTLITSRKEDAINFVSAGNIDNTEYTIVKATIIESNEITTEGKDENKV